MQWDMTLLYLKGLDKLMQSWEKSLQDMLKNICNNHFSINKKTRIYTSGFLYSLGFNFSSYNFFKSLFISSRILRNSDNKKFSSPLASAGSSKPICNLFSTFPVN